MVEWRSALAESEKMTVDESFKMPGAVPFKWEIRPGVPKVPTDHRHRRHSSHHQHDQEDEALRGEFPLPPRKLKPPSGFRFLPQEEEPRCRSCRSAPRAHSERWRVNLPVLAKPVCVSPGCIPTSSSLKLKDSIIRRSTSTRKSASPINGSPLESYPSLSISSPRLSISSYHSYRSPSPQPAQDADWAGFGLF